MRNIIVVDMQKGFICDSNKHLVGNIENYLKENEFDNIFLTKYENTPQSPCATILNWQGMMTEEPQQFVIDVPNNSIVIKKDCYGLSKQDTDYFKSLGIDEMEICGTDIDACCLAVAFNLFDSGIKPIILSQLCGTSSKCQNVTECVFSIIKRQFGADSIR